ncbi:MAG: alkaline phosphatase family protein, partial [Proteobacteria bacterium]
KPSYPAKTFPSHYTLVTGVKPTKHGIVSNEFFDPDLKKSFAVDERLAVEDPNFYLAEPLWITAQKNGMRTASYFWIGSETAIQGMLPNSYYRFSQQISAAAEVDQILEWIRLPEGVRPHLILGYLPEVDLAGHRYGTKSNELKTAVLGVDSEIGRLRLAIQESGLPVNLIVVSGQGMQDLEKQKTILIDESSEVAALLPKFQIKGRGPQMLLYLNAGESPLVKTAMRNALQNYAQSNKKPFRVLMTRKELGRLQYEGSNRVGDLVLEPELPWVIGTKASAPGTTGANHGWDSKHLSMHGIFYAEGPAFKKHGLLPALDSVNVAPLVLKTLGLPEPKGLDGKANAFKDILAPVK